MLCRNLICVRRGRRDIGLSGSVVTGGGRCLSARGVDVDVGLRDKALYRARQKAEQGRRHPQAGRGSQGLEEGSVHEHSSLANARPTALPECSIFTRGRLRRPWDTSPSCYAVRTRRRPWSSIRRGGWYGLSDQLSKKLACSGRATLAERVEDHTWIWAGNTGRPVCGLFDKRLACAHAVHPPRAAPAPDAPRHGRGHDTGVLYRDDGLCHAHS
jgi:hypothetical protein